jgi:glycosyltransferase involved in cell wall biosynthesis
VLVVLNAVDTGHFTPAPADGARLDVLAGLPPAPPGTLRVGLVATFARWKGQAVFLEAARKALDARPPVPLRFYVVGGPVYRTLDSQFSPEELRAQVERLGLTGHVGFVPFQQDPRDAYRALDIVAHASTRPEPFGLTIIEALACGRPTLVSAGGGAAELFTEGQDALGFQPGNADGLARRVLELAGSADLRARLAEKARTSAVERFSRERMGREVLALYRSLVSTPG